MHKIRVVNLLLLLALGPITAFCQRDKISNFKKMILKADSVYLVSHQITEVVVKFPKGNKLLKLISSNRVNYNLLIEKINLYKEEDRNRIFTILTKTISENETEMAKCIFPENAIIIVNKKKYSFIDLSFSCHRVLTSNDLSLNEFDFDTQKWDQLKNFFIEMGVKKGLE